MDRYKIRNQLVRKALFGGFLCDRDKLLNCNGYINNDIYDIGRSFLTFCYSKIFNIHRMYGFEEGYLSNNLYNRNKSFESLTVEDIDRACEELLGLYDYTQKYLKETWNIEDNQIIGLRALRPFEIEKISEQLRNKEDNISLYSNILSSYTKKGRLFEYGSCVTYVRKIDIKDIVLFYDAIEYPGEEYCIYPQCGGEYEIWVLNEDPFGFVTEKRNCFNIDEDEFNRRYAPKQNTSYYLQIPDNSDEHLVSNTLLPCESTKLIRYLINRQLRKQGRK